LIGVYRRRGWPLAAGRTHLAGNSEGVIDIKEAYSVGKWALVKRWKEFCHLTVQRLNDQVQVGDFGTVLMFCSGAQLAVTRRILAGWRHVVNCAVIGCLNIQALRFHRAPCSQVD
jgi:hypothetical protein